MADSCRNHVAVLESQRQLVLARSSGGPEDTQGKGEQEKEERVQRIEVEQAKPAGLVKGQGTAIVTGAVSILFGIAYLALVQFMDMRGGELQPPPPEAFMQ